MITITDEYVIFVTRNCNCSSMSFEQFCDYVMADFDAAKKVFENELVPKIKEQIYNNYYGEFDEKLNNKLISARNFAESYWKRKSRQEKYIAEVAENFSKEIEKQYNNQLTYHCKTIGYFDFDPSCDTSIASSSYWHISNKTTDYDLERLYEDMIKYGYFTKAIGWQFMFRRSSCGNFSLTVNGSRPQIKLIFNDEMAAQVERDQAKLVESVNNFYKNTTYFGD